MENINDFSKLRVEKINPMQKQFKILFVESGTDDPNHPNIENKISHTVELSNDYYPSLGEIISIFYSMILRIGYDPDDIEQIWNLTLSIYNGQDENSDNENQDVDHLTNHIKPIDNNIVITEEKLNAFMDQVKTGSEEFKKAVYTAFIKDIRTD